MKIVNKPIEVIASVAMNGKMIPHKIRVDLSEDESEVCKIKVKSSREVREFKERAIAYDCDLQTDDRIMPCEIRYYVDRVQWVLWKV